MKDNYGRLIRKIFLRAIGMVTIALLIGCFVMFFLVDGVFQDPFARFCVWTFENFLNVSDESARNMYYAIFRQNKEWWVLIGGVLLILLCFYRVLSSLTRYFKQLGNGVDLLLGTEGEQIRLSPELDFMERKLNTVKNTLVKRERDAKESEQRKNDLVVYLAHDIRTPLTSVIAYLSLLDEAPDMPAEQRAKYIGITLDKAYRLEQLINEFFEITRFNLQTVILNKEEIDLEFLLRQMSEEFYPLLSPNGQRVVLQIEENLSVWADPDKIARVYNNILKNAAAYSYPNSAILVRAHREQQVDGLDWAVVMVRNNGKQIPQNKLDVIFEKFFRLDEARSSNQGGAGLGLAIAKEIVSAHGGTIRAESSPESTAFTVRLPMKDFPAERTEGKGRW